MRIKDLKNPFTRAIKQKLEQLGYECTDAQVFADIFYKRITINSIDSNGITFFSIFLDYQDENNKGILVLSGSIPNYLQ